MLLPGLWKTLILLRLVKWNPYEPGFWYWYTRDLGFSGLSQQIITTAGVADSSGGNVNWQITDIAVNQNVASGGTGNECLLYKVRGALRLITTLLPEEYTGPLLQGNLLDG